MPEFHFLCGGSSAKQWPNCFGFAFLAPQVKELPGGDWLAKGNRIHSYREVLLDNFLRNRKNGAELIADSHFCGAEPEELAIARESVDSVWRNVFKQSVTGKAWAIERLFKFHEEYDAGGSADLILIGTDSKGRPYAHIDDLKTGRRRVEPSSEQNLFYAVCVRRLIRSLGKDIEYVISSIHQHTYHELYTEHIFSSKDLDRAEAKFEKACQEIFLKKNAKFKVGDWCGTCKCRADCPSYKAHIEKESDKLLAINDSGAVGVPLVESLTPEQKRRLIVYGPLFVDLYEKTKEQVTKDFLVGAPIAGLKLVESATRRKLCDDEDKVRDTLSPFGIATFDIITKMRGVTDIEKQIKKLADPEPAKRAFETLIERTQPKPILVPEDDKRPPMIANVDLLEDLSEELGDNE